MATKFGTNKNNKISGTNLKDMLFGMGGNDTISGGGGNDWINGGKGNDTLTGGTGNDKFVFAKGDGKDIIKDFKLDQDLLEIGGVTGMTVQKVIDTATASTSGADTIINLGSGQTITLKGVKLADFKLNALDNIVIS